MLVLLERVQSLHQKVSCIILLATVFIYLWILMLAEKHLKGVSYIEMRRR
jgi:hypothetical protein